MECNNKGGLYITYKKGLIYPSDHKCCVGWKIDQLNQKNLYCVRNIRDSKRKCTSEKVNDYTYKFATLCKDHTFACQ